MNFDALVHSIGELHHQLHAEAAKAVNVSLTLRNWLIGWHIAEYELKGEDRGQYGERLFAELAHRLTSMGLSNCNRRQLYRYRDFYRTYPVFVGMLSAQLQPLLPPGSTSPKVGTLSPQLGLSPEQLLNRLSYSHLLNFA
ncbi:MAG: DUF1016 N-terminal domain-containing protein [Phycisphaerae bacterium]|nr:DUF1016 N-terminal domain-containing protein [Phycisphaerae bacterium]